ncbi:MAG: DsbC family protein, partial [Planctomycetes bacterium]|nr:DsbC family protein [Planctomycetota bacterium]
MRIVVAASLAACMVVSAQVAAEEVPASVTEAVGELLQGMPADSIAPSQVPGLYEVVVGPHVVYVSADGKYMLRGDVIDLESRDNVTETRRRGARAEAVAKVSEDDMIVFGPKDAKHTVTVFTDIDCGYCRKLHSEIAKYNELGIRVRYLFFPRTGPDTESWDKAVAVWCSPNRNDALTRAKRGEAIKLAKCGTTPVDHDYELGQEIGLRGTPAILLANGDMLPGYVPPATLAKRL